MDDVFSSLKELSTNVTQTIWHMNKSSVLDGIIMLPKRWDSVIEKQGDYIEGLWRGNLKEIKVLVKNHVHFFLNDLSNKVTRTIEHVRYVNFKKFVSVFVSLFAYNSITTEPMSMQFW